jgi:hypothetical protein
MGRKTQVKKRGGDWKCKEAEPFWAGGYGKKTLGFDIPPPNSYNESSYLPRGALLADKDDPSTVEEEQTLNIERLKRRLDMLDQRLDNIDSMVTAVAERVMEQPLNFSLTCPHCGKHIEITILGSQKPTV